jgi:hypothetical protein
MVLPMSDTYTTPKVTDLAQVVDQLQSLLGSAVENEASRNAEFGADPQLQEKLQRTLAELELVGVFNLLEGSFGARSWEGSGCHEEEFKLLWALRSAFVFGNGLVRKLRGNHHRKTITEGLQKLQDGGFGVAPYFELVDDVVRLEGASLRLGALVKDLLQHQDQASPE